MTGVVVDSSAVMAVLRGEPERDRLLDLLQASTRRLISAPTAVELGIVLGSRTRDFGRWQRVLRDTSIDTVGWDEAMTARAVDAFRRFGKGRHPAGLNYGDCFTYALAEERGLPILAVGDDFRRTDLQVLPG